MLPQILELTRGHVTVRVGERTATLQGEMLIGGPGIPDFVAYSDTLKYWSSPHETVLIAPADRVEVLECLRLAAKHRGLVLEIE